MLTFKEFQKVNADRCTVAFGHLAPHPDPWGLNDWLTAVAGEVGEAANLAKKVRRGDFGLYDRITIKGVEKTVREHLLDELADAVTYLDVTISFLGAETARVITDKFNEISDRVGYAGKLEA